MSDQVETPQTEAPAAPSLSIQDLVTVCKVLQLVSQRGAIQVTEMSQVGPVYDRIVAFLEANGAVQRAPAPEAAPAEEK